MSKSLQTILLLIASNIFMTLAWYGSLKLKEMGKISDHTPVVYLVLGSWAIALLEYALMIPANRLGSVEFDGPFSLLQLKIIQEAITLTIFVFFVLFFFKNEAIRWNHLVGLAFLMLAVYFIFKK